MDYQQYKTAEDISSGILEGYEAYCGILLPPCCSPLSDIVESAFPTSTTALSFPPHLPPQPCPCETAETR
jgi:hypothetical protein